MGRRGPQPLPAALKASRGTLRPSRERRQRPVVPATVDGPVPPPRRDFVAAADGYVSDVQSGRIVAGQWLSKAVQRYQDMRTRAASGTVDFTFSPEHVQA